MHPVLDVQILGNAVKEMLYKKNSKLEGKEISLPIVTNALTHGNQHGRIYVYGSGAGGYRTKLILGKLQFDSCKWLWCKTDKMLIYLRKEILM